MERKRIVEGEKKSGRKRKKEERRRTLEKGMVYCCAYSSRDKQNRK